jgi:hypothetical protein
MGLVMVLSYSRFLNLRFFLMPHSRTLSSVRSIQARDALANCCWASSRGVAQPIGGSLRGR